MTNFRNISKIDLRTKELKKLRTRTMKKYLPLILLGLGIIVLLGVYFLVFRKSSRVEDTEVEGVPEVTLADRPVTSLTPSSDGHWLELNITKIKVKAASLDYELLYDLPDGRTQGVPGSIRLQGAKTIERDLLLGSESSGKYRYDEGVNNGTITLRFRDEKGKLVAKFSTEFHLQSDTKNLTSADGKFSYMLDKNPGNEYFVTMETFGYPGDAPGQVSVGPYGVFKGEAMVNTAKGTLPVTTINFPGTVKLTGGTIYRSDGDDWKKLSGDKSSDVGIFVATK